MSETAATEFILPSALIGRADLARLIREVEAIDSVLATQKVKAQGEVSYHMPTMSQSLSDFLAINKVDLANDRARMVLKEQLEELKDKAPIVHMTFATSADPETLQELVDWVRKQLHPRALISVGLQPALVGGVYMRTPNHVYDFSLRALMSDKRDVISRQLEELVR
jgi:F0F1-type ATP synthase delta subunit